MNVTQQSIVVLDLMSHRGALPAHLTFNAPTSARALTL